MGITNCIFLSIIVVFYVSFPKCQGSPDIRLVDGDGSYRGRLEIRHTGEGGPEWGTVCNKNFNFAAASVVCRQLGYTGAYRVQSFRSGPTGGVIWLENVQCNGNEVSIMDCKYDGWGNTSCSHHDDDVGIICIAKSGSVQVYFERSQLYSNDRVGSVEIFTIGNWGSIDYYSSWNTNHMQIVCRQLGYEFATGNYPKCTTCDNVPRAHVFPTNLWKTSVKCDGNEASLIDCDAHDWSLDRVHTATYDVVLVHCKVPVQGGWSEWSYSQCSHTCFGGKQVRTRICNNPTPQNNGEPCVGNSSEVVACGSTSCAMPQIIKISTNQEVISNRTAEFCCNATGKPIATFQWLRHGVQLSRKQINVAYSTVGSVCDDKNLPSLCNSSSTLQIFNTTATDGGEYTCVATNKIESVTAPVNLTVDVIPKITKAPLDTNILSSGDVNFTCIAIGKPRATITWSRNTNTITNNIYKDIPGIIINSIVGNCTIDDPLSQCLSSSTLQITDAAAVDSGEYTCIATNKVGSNEKTAKLIVNVIPAIIEAPADLLVTVHVHVNFTCTAGAKPRCAIYWFRNNRLLSNNSLSDGGVPVIITSSTIGSCTIADPPSQCASTSTLLIFNVALSDGGGYTCVSSNEFGADNYTAFLFVNEQPDIIKSPINKYITSSGNVSFTCTAANKPQPLIDWLRNGKILSNNSLSDGGVPVVIVTNSSTEHCGINDPPIQCVSSSTLTIFDTRVGDSGNYTCLATNAFGNDSKQASLIVNVIPIITESPEDVTIQSGESVNFSCNAAAKPRAVITWIRNGTILSNNSLSDGAIITNSTSGNCTITDLPSHCTSSSTLQLFNSMPIDSGEYICVAANVAGNDTFTANLTVNVVPVITQPPVDRNITAGEDVNFTCTATGKPRAVISWFRNNNELMNNSFSDGSSPIIINDIKNGNCTITDPPSQCVSSSILHILNTTTPDSGVYSCIATNKAGNATNETNLVVNVVPTIVQPPGNKTVKSSEDSRFTCTATGKPRAVISWFRHNMLIHNNSLGNGSVPVIITNSILGNCTITDPPSQCVTSSSLQISNATAIDGGQYTCVAANVVGNDTNIGTLIVNVVPTIHTMAKWKILLLDNARMNCNVTAKPLAKIKWFRHNKELISNYTLSDGGVPIIITNNTMEDCTIDSPISQCVSSSTLQISDSRTVDSGDYMCVATNVAGKDEEIVSLVVNVKPVITQPPVDRDVISGEDVKFTCTATGKPRAVISWFRYDTKPIHNNSRSDGGVPVIITNSTMGNCTITDPPSQCVSSSTLQIFNTTERDNGKYTCEATNEMGRISSSAKLIVNGSKSTKNGIWISDYFLTVGIPTTVAMSLVLLCTCVLIAIRRRSSSSRHHGYVEIEEQGEKKKVQVRRQQSDDEERLSDDGEPLYATLT